MARMLLFFLVLATALAPLGSRGSTQEDMMETAERQVEDMEAELRQWGERLSKLVATADASGTIAKVDYRNRLDHLRQKYAAAESRFAELKAAGSGRRDVYQGAVEDAWIELAIAFTKLAN